MTTHDQDWMLEEVTWVQGVRHAVVLTSDGLVKARSEGTGDDVSDRLAATCSALASLGYSVATEFGDAPTVHQVMVDYDGGYLFVRLAAERAHLAVITAPTVDPALIAQQMQAQVLKLGERGLSTPIRQNSAL